eukprot:SAG22_NODE_3696_length_1572_cov_0.919212_1_plen_182_part_00
MKFDAERFVDLKTMEQKRYDDEDGRRRAVQRAAKGAAAAGGAGPAPGALLSQAVNLASTDDDDGDHDDDDSDDFAGDDDDDDEDEDEDEDEEDEDEYKEDDEDDESDDDVGGVNVKWFWKGDSAGGSQDIWVEYSSKASQKFEAAKQAGKAEVKVDKERLIALSDPAGMYQVRRRGSGGGE